MNVGANDKSIYLYVPNIIGEYVLNNYVPSYISIHLTLVFIVNNRFLLFGVRY